MVLLLWCCSCGAGVHLLCAVYHSLGPAKLECLPSTRSQTRTAPHAHPPSPLHHIPQEAKAAVEHAIAGSDETCALYAAAIAARAAAAEAAASSAAAAGHAAAFHGQQQADVSGFVTGATDAAALVKHAHNIATVAARALSCPAAPPAALPSAQQQGAVAALKLTFAAAQQGTQAATSYAAAAAHAGLQAHADEAPRGQPAEAAMQAILSASAAAAAADARQLCDEAAQAMGAQQAAPGAPLLPPAQHQHLAPAAPRAAVTPGAGLACPMHDTPTLPGHAGASHWLAGMQRGLGCRWLSLQELAMDVLPPNVAKPLAVMQPAAFPNLRALELRRCGAVVGLGHAVRGCGWRPCPSSPALGCCLHRIPGMRC